MKTIVDGIIGLAIGDAMGVPYEFKSRGAFNCDGMVGFGSHNQPKGTWSDDTAMTLATLDSINACGGIDTLDMFARYKAWLDKGWYAIDKKVFDVGNTTSWALTTGIPCDDEKSNGNGSLMRVLPLAFTECSGEEICAVSMITHGHWVSQMACKIYVDVARRIAKGEKIESIIPTLKFGKPFDRLCYIGTLTEEEIHSTGYVVDTLEASLWVLFNTNTFRETILKAVNLGSDTDTTAAVTGGLAGLMYGYDEEWYKELRGKDIIEKVLGGKYA